MNDYHDPLPLLPRAAGSALEQAANRSPVVVLLGARQTGKTTLVRSHPSFSELPYLTLDDFDLREQALSDPEAVVARAPAVILDEVQRARDLLIAVKRAVDRDTRRTPGRFILTGSANILMMERIGETLAGRAAYVTLLPFTRSERLGHGGTGPWSDLLASEFPDWRDAIEAREPLPEEWRKAVRLGGLPEPSYRRAGDEDAREQWYSGYVQTYLERDLQTLRSVESLPDFRRLMRAAALRIGGLVNQTELGRDTGISQPQVHRFLNVLETSFQLIRLPAYSVNRTRRLIKSPKLYWSDTGLALHLSGEKEPRGAHLENLVLLNLAAWRELQAKRPEILYWRTATGREVDFVVESSERLLPIEVKAARKVRPPDARGLTAFLEEYPDLSDGGLLLYGGEESFPLTRNVLAVPWWRLC